MTALRRRRSRPARSYWRPLAFLAASGMAIAGIAGAGSAGADQTPAPPEFTYSSNATAIGVQVALTRNPDFSSLPDPFDVIAPHSEAQLDSFGTSTADGHVVNLHGAGGVPGLVCLAAGAATCAQIPIKTITAGLIPTFPPPDPVDAHASYPAHQTGKAPILGSTPAQLSIDSGGFGLDVGAASAAAHQYDTSTTARIANLGVPAALTVGGAVTSTTQTATAESLTTTATAKLSDIDLAGPLLHIGTMTSTTTVVSKPGKKPTDTTSTELADVKVAGLAATIDSDGIHLGKNGLPTNFVAALEKAVNSALKAAGIEVELAKVERSDSETGHTVAASGLAITFNHAVKGTQPITIAPPQGLPCPEILKNFPVDPCSGVSFGLDGLYHGQVVLGQVGVVSLATPGGSDSLGLPPDGTTIPTTEPGDGVPGLGGEDGVPPIGPGVDTSEPPVSPPAIAPGQRHVADQLGDVSRRLEWFFPLFALGVFALIGRIRLPARLPGPK